MDLKKTTIKGLISIGSSKVILQGIGIVITTILANLLSPKDFGLIGIVSVYTALVNTFSNLGLGSALVQKKDVTQIQLSTLFWINLIGGGISALLIGLSAYPISIFYHEPQLFYLTLVLSINFLIGPFFQINRKLLEKELRFVAVGMASVIAILISGIAGVMAALNKLGAWSLVIQSISQELSYLVIFYFQRRWVPKVAFDFKSCRELLQFGIHMVGSNIALYFERNLDSLLIGKLLGAISLGYYTLAIKIMYMPVRQISYIFTEVLFPIFSKIQDRLEKIQSGYLKSIRFTSLITFPLMTLVFILSKDLVEVLWGPKWLPSVPVIRILAPVGAIQSIIQIGWAIFPAVNQSRTRMGLGIFDVVVLLIAIILGKNWGLVGIAYGILFSRLLLFVVSHVLLNKLIRIDLREVLSSFALSLLGCVVLVILDTILRNRTIFLNGGGLKILFLLTAIYVAIYAIYLILFDKKDLKYLINGVLKSY